MTSLPPNRWKYHPLDFLAMNRRHKAPRRQKHFEYASLETLEQRWLMSVADMPWLFDSEYAPPAIDTATLADFHEEHLVHTDEDGNMYYVEPCVAESTPPEPLTGDDLIWKDYDLSETFLLHSYAGADHVIYLDFDGHKTTGTNWNSQYGSSIITPAYDTGGDTSTFDDSELARIQRIWARVAEDYAPFMVNITTEDPGVAALRKSGARDMQWGVRVVIGANTWRAEAGGIAYVDSFNWNSDTPVFVFNDSEIGVAEAASHEAGHALGLTHDGVGISSYYTGHGSGATSWGPTMGASYGRSLTQWSKGEYNNANEHEDDLAIISTQNGFGYRIDDYGDSTGAASQLLVQGDSIIRDTFGIIEEPADNDVFSFWAAAGPISINIDPLALGANLDVLAEIFDASGGVVADSNSTPVSSSI